MTRWAVAGLLVVGGVVGCGRAPEGGRSDESEAAADASGMEVGSAPAAPAGSAEEAKEAPATVAGSQLESAAVTQGDGQRAFIRTAAAVFDVQDVYKTALAIEDQVAALGGHVVENDIQSEITDVRRRPLGQERLLTLSRYQTQASLTVRLPTARTQEFLRGLARQMTFLERRNFQARDAQLEILRARLAEQRALQTQSVIAEAGEQGRTRDRVQAAQAQDNARLQADAARLAQLEYADRVSFSTLHLTFRQPPQVRASEEVDTDAVMRDRGPGFFRRLAASLGTGWNGALEVVLAAAALWPLWLLVLAMLAGMRAWRRRAARLGPPPAA